LKNVFKNRSIYDLARMRCTQQRLALLYLDSSASHFILSLRGLVHRAALIVFPGIRQLCRHYC